MAEITGRNVPFSQYCYVDVTFNATANADTVIPHTLKVIDPYNVEWQLVRLSFGAAPATPPTLYRDTSLTAKAWGLNYIVLRSNVASLSTTLLLTVRR